MGVLRKNIFEKSPQFIEENFNCPHCNVLAYQNWAQVFCQPGRLITIKNLNITFCQNCSEYSLWKDGKMIYPIVSTVPLPNNDMPDNVKEIYKEARQIQQFSPRAAAALLRVALEKLTAHLGENSGNLNTRIGNLNKKGLPGKVINSLDIVRINSNEGGSHAGQIDLTGNDDSDIVDKLFFLVNFIVEKTITENEQIKDMFQKLPEDKKRGIANRDK